MKCLLRYQWVKLPRSCMPQGKGVMGNWAKLAARAAFRKGEALYCGHRNPVEPGMWSGGIVGLKSILRAHSRSEALKTMEELNSLGFISYTLEPKTKKLTYQLVDWVVECSGAECIDRAVYATSGYGFLCLPRNITERLVRENRKFDEADAWLDLWCHTTFQDPGNAFSFLAPAIQYGKNGAVLTLETLGRRWGWEKTKVWRFFKKHGDVFPLYRLPGSYGCLVFNTWYPTGAEVSLPNMADVLRIISEMRSLAGNACTTGSDCERLNRIVTWYSRAIVSKEPSSAIEQEPESRVALSAPLLRAYISLCWNCRNCVYDCKVDRVPTNLETGKRIRGPCRDDPFTLRRQEFYNHGKTKYAHAGTDGRRFGSDDPQWHDPGSADR